MDLLKKIVFTILALLALIVLLRAFSHNFYPDFSVYYSGSKSYLATTNPYITKPDYFSNYVYPPFVLLLFIPFVFLPQVQGAIIFTALSVVCLGGGIYFTLKAIKNLSKRSFLIAFTLSILAFPTKFTLGMGQMNLVVLLFISCSFYFLMKKKGTLSGGLLGISFALKFFPFLLLFFFMLKKQWKAFLSTLIVFILLGVVAALITGFELQQFYLHNVLVGVGDAYQKDYYNQALSGFFARLPVSVYLGKSLKVIASILLVLSSLYVVFKTRDKKLNNTVGFSLLLTLGLIVNPFSWQHHFVWLIIPFIITYYSLKQFSIPLVISYILVAINFAQPEKLPALFQSHVLFGTIFLWFIQAKLLLHKK